MPLIDPYRGTVGAYKPDLSGNCPDRLARALERIQRARNRLNVLRWELVQTGEHRAASEVARAVEELGNG